MTSAILICLQVIVGCVELEPASETSQAREAATKSIPFAELSYWDDGLAEMCYYDATDRIYNRKRDYTRTMLINREWIDPATMVKAQGDDMTGMTPVLKITIAEEIPTENYNYRYLIGQYLRRPDLRFEKLAVSSQEWCGTTFKQLRRGDDGVSLKGFSYFEGEGDREWQLPTDGDIYPTEALFVLARQVASTRQPMTVQAIAPLRSTHLQAPKLTESQLVPAETVSQVSVPAGNYAARQVTLKQGDESVAEFWVAADSPYLLLKYDRSEAGMSLKLRAVEKRPYWDRSSKSDFYRQHRAP